MIGERIKTLRIEKNLLQKDLAKKLNLSQQTISLYESNRRQPDYLTLQNIATFFNVSVDYLLGRTDIRDFSKVHIKEPEEKYISDKIFEDIKKLSPKSQEELIKLIELYKIRDIQEKKAEISDNQSALD